MAVKHYVVQSRDAGNGGMLTPLGSRRDIESALACHNTMTDRVGGHRLYGPGFELELAPEEDPVLQMGLNVSDDDIAWIVLVRLSHEFQWKIVDPNSGRELSP